MGTKTTERVSASKAKRVHRKGSGKLRKVILTCVYIGLCLLFVALGAAAGLYIGYSYDLPSLSVLEDYRPDVITEIYSDDDHRIGQFFLEKRVLIKYEEIPKYFKEAIISAEDKNFYRHPGIDVLGILRAAVKNLMAGKVVEGGSTLSQQLSKLLFLKPEKSFDRKIKEALLAMKIERSYSKKQILTFYCNQIYMGHGTYGVAAAADFYFGKTPDQITIEEGALLASIPKSPGSYSPIYHPKNALPRRNYIIDRMAEEGYITKAEADAAKRVPLRLRKPTRDEERLVAPYFVEWVRRSLEERYETDEIWRKGLRVHTTLDSEMQRAANRALAENLRAYDKRHGWRGIKENVLDTARAKNEPIDLDSYMHHDWKAPFKPGDVVTGLVTEVRAKEARVRFKDFTAVVGPKDIEWTYKKSPQDIFRVGDLAVFKINDMNSENTTLKVTLDQTPEVQGALVCLENSTGAIKAMVGGYNFSTSKFNRATQALRQTGSSFKPFVYTTALESGYTPDDLILDAPISFPDGMGHLWSPQNYDREYKGMITLRKAIAESRNIPAVRLASHVSVTNIIRTVRRFGIMSDTMQPYLPLALGAAEVSLLDMTSAYAVFPNKGLHAKPYFIRRIDDYEGNLKEEAKPESTQVISQETAVRMIELLRGVVAFGTATRAKSLNRPVAGKTGTTNDFTDAWFIGFTPSLTCGVWIGFDEKKSLGNKETGGKAALPAWLEFMKEVLKDMPVEDFDLTVEVQEKLVAEAATATETDTEQPTTDLPEQTMTAQNGSAQNPPAQDGLVPDGTPVPPANTPRKIIVEDITLPSTKANKRE